MKPLCAAGSPAVFPSSHPVVRGGQAKTCRDQGAFEGIWEGCPGAEQSCAKALGSTGTGVLGEQ